MGNDTEFCYKPLNRFKLEPSNNRESVSPNQITGMHIISIANDQMAKLTKSPRLQVETVNTRNEHSETTTILQKWITASMKNSSSQQSQISSETGLTADNRKGQTKERKTSSTDQNDFGVCLLRDSPFRILRVSAIKFNI